MNTRRLKKRDRAWAKAMLVCWKDDLGRSWRSNYPHRVHHAACAEIWERGDDHDQQEALQVGQGG
ncbi:MAG: hypothetical protein V4563_14860 [Pseudomonadota bacterium]